LHNVVPIVLELRRDASDGLAGAAAEGVIAKAGGDAAADANEPIARQ
jgi:hypothetical protein